jgi:hypothetical protein
MNALEMNTAVENLMIAFYYETFWQYPYSFRSLRAFGACCHKLKQVGRHKPHKQKTRHGPGLLFVRSLTMTYFRMGNPHYHRRGVVSLSCSGWEGVGPTRYGRQTNW